MEKKSYYDCITDIIDSLDRTYDTVGCLRDCASLNEKQIYNDTRAALGSLIMQWRRFQNSIPLERAEMLL